MDKPFVEMLDEFFKDQRMKDLLCALTGYLSDNPNSLTVGHMAPIFGYHYDGGYYPVGGSQAFPNALVDVIEKHGGKVYPPHPCSTHRYGKRSRSRRGTQERSNPSRQSHPLECRHA